MGWFLWTVVLYFLPWIIRDVGQRLCFLIKFTAISSMYPCEIERNNEKEGCCSSSSLNRADLCGWEQPLLNKTLLSTPHLWIAYLQLDLRHKGTSMLGFLEKGLSKIWKSITGLGVKLVMVQEGGLRDSWHIEVLARKTAHSTKIDKIMMKTLCSCIVWACNTELLEMRQNNAATYTTWEKHAQCNWSKFKSFTFYILLFKMKQEIVQI